MNQTPEPTIRVRVDPTNPGEFFACCGLLELADRLWDGAEGWFAQERQYFFLSPLVASIAQKGMAAALIDQIASSRLSNTMTEPQLQRREQLSAMPKKEREEPPLLEAEKKELDGLWRDAPVLLRGPFDLCLDWFADSRAGGDDMKTWAGQQSVLDIARAVKAPIDAGGWHGMSPENWLQCATCNVGVPFNFDSDLGGMGSARDIGFSLDPLKDAIGGIRTHPLVEFAAFVGLQRFRPVRIGKENRYCFSTWSVPLVPEVAAVAACGLLEAHGRQSFQFQLLYRSKYLKSFLPATPIERN